MWKRRPEGIAELDPSGASIPSMRKLWPWIGAVIVLIALWPTLCVSQEGGPTSCQSALFLPLPWGESADTWGMVTAVVAAVLTYFVLRMVLRRSASKAP
jgi:hypothetical protein